jgi:hypothetical protein
MRLRFILVIIVLLGTTLLLLWYKRYDIGLAKYPACTHVKDGTNNVLNCGYSNTSFSKISLFLGRVISYKITNDMLYLTAYTGGNKKNFSRWHR